MLQLKGLKPEDKGLKKTWKLKIIVKTKLIYLRIRLYDLDQKNNQQTEGKATDGETFVGWQRALSLRGPVHCSGLEGESDDEMS